MKRGQVRARGFNSYLLSEHFFLSFLPRRMKLYLKFRFPYHQKLLLNICRVSLLPHQLPRVLWHGSPVCLLQNKTAWSNFVISDNKRFDLVFKCQIINRKRISRDVFKVLVISKAKKRWMASNAVERNKDDLL